MVNKEFKEFKTPQYRKRIFKFGYNQAVSEMLDFMNECEKIGGLITSHKIWIEFKNKLKGGYNE